MTKEQERLMQLIRFGIWVAIVTVIIILGTMVYIFPAPATVAIAGVILFFFWRRYYHDQ